MFTQPLHCPLAPDGRAVLVVVPDGDAQLHTTGSCHADAQGNRPRDTDVQILLRNNHLDIR